MNKKQTAAVITAVALVAAGRFSYVCLLNDIHHRFPSVDRKTAQKAFRKMWTGAARGEYPDLDSFNERQMDALFLALVQEVRSGK